MRSASDACGGIKPFYSLRGELSLPGDKSLSHRYLFFAALAEKPVRLRNLPEGKDVRTSIDCLRKLGVRIDRSPSGETTVYPFEPARSRLSKEAPELYCGNSGTTARFLLGFLTAFGLSAKLTGDESLSRRPMQRAAEPLRQMGSVINFEKRDNLPVAVLGLSRLKSIDWKLQPPSAQVKTAILLAGLKAEGETIVTESKQSRNHTEIILKETGADIEVSADAVKVKRLSNPLSFPSLIIIPGDISTAAFYITGAALLPGSDLLVKDILLNPHRSHFIEILRRMGADIATERQFQTLGECCGDLRVAYNGRLKGIELAGEEALKCIDEIPILSLAAAAARGRSLFKDLEELRVKESDRLSAIGYNLKMLGIDVKIKKSSIEIKGRTFGAVFLNRPDKEPLVSKSSLKKLGSGRKYPLKDSSALPVLEFDSFSDHRIAMTMQIASIISRRDCIVKDPLCAAASAPEFYKTLESLLIERKPETVFLAGFMGSGKSTIGKLLAGRLGYAFADLDEMIIARQGKPVWKIFEEYGEEAFRRFEKQELMSLRSLGNTVIALGGGTTCDPENLAYIQKTGLLVTLYAPGRTMYKRIKGKKDRPLATRWSDFISLLENRVQCYYSADIFLNAAGDIPQVGADMLEHSIKMLLGKSSVH